MTIAIHEVININRGSVREGCTAHSFSDATEHGFSPAGNQGGASTEEVSPWLLASVGEVLVSPALLRESCLMLCCISYLSWL